MGALHYTNNPQPNYSNKFHDVRQLIDAWNAYMAEEYFAGWWNCLDKSMSIFNNPYCPGWMVVPWKPHLYGNEYHSICDGNHMAHRVAGGERLTRQRRAKEVQ